MSVSLTLLGTGTPAPLTHRTGSSYLVQAGRTVLMFDCGPGAVRRLLEAGKAFSGQILFAEDHLTVPLDDIVPAEIR